MIGHRPTAVEHWGGWSTSLPAASPVRAHEGSPRPDLHRASAHLRRRETPGRRTCIRPSKGPDGQVATYRGFRPEAVTAAGPLRGSRDDSDVPPSARARSGPREGFPRGHRLPGQPAVQRRQRRRRDRAGPRNLVLAAGPGELQAVGALRRVPRSRVIVHELTPGGRKLEPVVLALGAWGFQAMGDPRPEQITIPAPPRPLGRWQRGCIRLDARGWATALGGCRLRPGTSRGTSTENGHTSAAQIDLTSRLSGECEGADRRGGWCAAGPHVG